MFYVNTGIYCWSCLSCRLPMLRSTCLRCLHSRSRQMTHAALSRSTVKVHILVTFVVSSEQNWADKFISLETKSSYLSVRHNSFCYLPHLYVCKVDFTLYVRDLVWLNVVQNFIRKYWNMKWTESFETVVEYILVYESMYLFCTGNMYISTTYLLFWYPWFEWLVWSKMNISHSTCWIICHGRDGCTLINNKSAFLDV